MREPMDAWPFVAAAYLLVIGVTIALVAWSWLAMRRAEARRDEARGTGVRGDGTVRHAAHGTAGRP